MNKWYSEPCNNDICICSKVEISRNFSDLPFPLKMNDDHKKAVIKRVYATIKNSRYATDFELINCDDLDQRKINSYVENGLLPDNFNETFLLSNSYDEAIVLNNDDHILMEAYSKDLSLDIAYNVLYFIDDLFINNFKIAYNDELGFLTSSPYNVGTGLKASIELHLVALKQHNLISRLNASLNRIGMKLYPKYDNEIGDVFVLTNLLSTGISEKDIINNLIAIASNIIDKEKAERSSLVKEEYFEDLMYRNLGILKSARNISTHEFLNSMSLLRLGVSEGLFDYSYELIDEMLYTLMDNSIMTLKGDNYTTLQCAKIRADIIREKLG